MSGNSAIPARWEDVRLALTVGGHDELQVLPASYPDLPELRVGLTLTLEPGMRDPILAALPRVERVTQLTAAVCTVTEPLLGRTREPYTYTVLKSHEIDAVESIAAGIVLGRKMSMPRSGRPCCGRRSTRRGPSAKRAITRSTWNWAPCCVNQSCKPS
ncbi:hypothetical protein [Burkholderia ubonensis]|uniref:hypothetical protein n=1 Tax=Burkholderia ubonensis TaxID=101571 RepID=UPI000A9033A0|nr:hypothetical protein [Burkholderia ubonensis]